MKSQESLELEHSMLVSQDEQAFKKLVKENHRHLLSLAQSIVSHAIAEEVVQEAWISIYSSLPNFKGQSSIKTWIYKITINKAISHLRKEKREHQQLEEAHNDSDVNLRFNTKEHSHHPMGHWDDSGPHNMLVRAELLECITHTLAKLPVKQRAAFMMSHLENSQTENICHELNISTANFKVLLHRARLKLFGHIAQYQKTGEC